MKKIIIQFFLFIMLSFLNAEITSITKINEFAFAQRFIGRDSFIINENYLYTRTTFGVECYEINDNGELNKLSHVLIHSPKSFVIDGDYVYVTNQQMSDFSIFPISLYQIDYSDKYAPVIINQIDFDINTTHYYLQIIHDYLYLMYFSESGEDLIYSIPGLEYIQSIQYPITLIMVNENIAVDIVGASEFNIFDISNFPETQVTGTVEMYQYHQDYTPDRFITLNDTIVIAVGQTAVTFWDISNPSNWDYINVYYPGSYLVVHNSASVLSSNLFLLRYEGIEMLDISDLTNIYLVDFIDILSSLYDLNVIDSNIYVSTYSDGIQHYGFSESELNFIEDIYDYPSFYYSHLYMNYLFIKTNSHGVYLFNLENPYEPEHLGEIFSGSLVGFMKAFENRLVLKDYSDSTYQIYDISNPESPVLHNIIEENSLDELLYSIVSFDNSIGNIYIFDRQNSILKKYNISESMSSELLFEYSDISADNFIVHNGIGYLLEHNDSYQNLYIIDGFDDNLPNLQNTINFFSYYNNKPWIRILNGYFCLTKSGEPETRFFNLNDPFNPEFQFELEVPSTQPDPLFYEDYIYTQTADFSYIYEIGENSFGIIEPSNDLFTLSYIIDIHMNVLSDSIKHLIYTQDSNVAIFEIEYNVAVDDNELFIDNDFNIYNYPNPYKPNTTIEYSIPKKGKVGISIYNIKGQKIKTLINNSLEQGKNSVTWNGKDENNRSVASGIYFYKLKFDDKIVSSRKCLLLR